MTRAIRIAIGFFLIVILWMPWSGHEPEVVKHKPYVAAVPCTYVGWR